MSQQGAYSVADHKHMGWHTMLYWSFGMLGELMCGVFRADPCMCTVYYTLHNMAAEQTAAMGAHGALCSDNMPASLHRPSIVARPEALPSSSAMPGICFQAALCYAAAPAYVCAFLCAVWSQR